MSEDVECEGVWIGRCANVSLRNGMHFYILSCTFQMQTSLSIPTLYVWQMEITPLVELRSTTMACGGPFVTTTGL